MRAATARAVYRSRQLFGSLRPRIDGERRARALALLTPPKRRLFEAMTPRDQAHCLAVYERLCAQGHTDKELTVAALLHDAGKGRIALWHRVAYVLLAARAPGLLRRFARPGDGPSWREALYRCWRHPQLGAELARRAGCSDAVVTLIEANENGGGDQRLAALLAADDAV